MKEKKKKKKYDPRQKPEEVFVSYFIPFERFLHKYFQRNFHSSSDFQTSLRNF
jgi:hypothetical protein